MAMSHRTDGLRIGSIIEYAPQTGSTKAIAEKVMYGIVVGICAGWLGTQYGCDPYVLARIKSTRIRRTDLYPPICEKPVETTEAREPELQIAKLTILTIPLARMLRVQEKGTRG